MKANQDRDLDLRDFFVVLRRRRNVLYTIAGLVLACSILYCIFSTSEYESIATLQVLNEAPDGISNGAAFGGAATGIDAQTAPIVDKTEAVILSSDSLALQTIERLHLDRAWKLPAAKAGSTPTTSGQKSLTKEDAAREQAELRIFHRRLSVQPISGTRMIAIRYRDPNPVVAAQVVNTLSQELIDYTISARHDATASATQWLSAQLADLRKESQGLQDRVVELQQQSSVYGLASADANSRDASYSGLIDQLQQATSAYNQAQQNRSVKTAIARIAETGDADTLSGLAGNVLGGSSAAESLALIQSLRGQEATLRADIAEMETKYGNAFPRLIESRQKLASLQAAVTQEINRVRQRAESDAKIAQTEEQQAKARYDQVQSLASGASGKAAEYTIAREDALRSRTLYEDLVRQLKEANIGAEMKSANLTVVDPGRVTAKASSPNVPLIVLLGLLGGSFLGICGALLAEATDKKVYRPTAIESETHQPCNLALPEFHATGSATGKSSLEGLVQSNSDFAEAVRTLRSSLLATTRPNEPKTILVTSSASGEGGSTVSFSLAAVMSQYGRRVLLVDADLRRGTLISDLKLQKGPGLTELLSGASSAARIQTLPSFPMLEILGAGELVAHAAELLDSPAMQSRLQEWRSTYDVVVLHGAPTFLVADSVLLSSLVDVTLFVTRSGFTQRQQLRQAFSKIESSKGESGRLFTVLNAVQSKEGGY